MFQTRISPTIVQDGGPNADNLVSERAIFRPIQYLGSKLRSLESILAATDHLYAEGDLVVDLFSGSSVVSQAFANAHARVLAVDSQTFCAHMANALLSVARLDNENSSVWARQIVEEFREISFPEEINSLLEQEDRILANGPDVRLLDFYATLPQAWKEPVQGTWLASAAQYRGQSGFNRVPIISAYYSGSYFGLRQALFFDFVRNRIQTLREIGALNLWTESALLTALYSAMSRVVSSAGKHFAQPLASKETGNKQFQAQRLFSDRSTSAQVAYLGAANKIDRSAVLPGYKHQTIAQPVDSIYQEVIEFRPKLIYADPPYTAQQYSRFYHVLEVMAKYVVPELQMVNNRVTSGLYNINRYKSPFSSKTQAEPAFERLVSSAKASGASLAISYSSSSDKSTGNARMIGLADLASICRRHFGSRVDIAELDHVYKPFNSEDKNNVYRSDPEVLIICEA